MLFNNFKEVVENKIERAANKFEEPKKSMVIEKTKAKFNELEENEDHEEVRRMSNIERVELLKKYKISVKITNMVMNEFKLEQWADDQGITVEEMRKQLEARNEI